MSLEDDYLFALEVQKRINADVGEQESDIIEVDFKKPSSNSAVSKKPLQIKRSNPHSNLDEDFMNRTQNLVHPQWETLDPTPDIFALFGQFDAKFFQKRLKCVTLEWSKRMYSCAGICYSRRNRYGMDVTIRLSQPLLILRPRKDLVETMLHEMIHAYCFVLNIREGNGGHGPYFKKIMSGINKVAGTNITVYHTFHDEVNVYKQHWWRCNGVCQDRAPFLGYVKRTSNRAPGPNDQWWASHMQNCGGTFMKIKEPEKKNIKAAKHKEKENKKKNFSAQPGSDLRKFFTPLINSTNPATSESNIKGLSNFDKGYKGPVKTNGGGTMLLNPIRNSTSNVSQTKTSTPAIVKAFPPSSYPGLSTDPFRISTSNIPVPRNRTSGTTVPPGGNLRNVIGIRDLGNLGSGVKGVITAQNDWGRGNKLTSTSISFTTNNTTQSSGNEKCADRQHLRDIWCERFGKKDANCDTGKRIGFQEVRINNEEGDVKRRRLSSDSELSSNVEFVAVEHSSNRKKEWIIVDDDIMLREETDKVITLSSDEDGETSDPETTTKPKIKREMTLDQRQTMIKKEIIDESIDLSNDDIELIDDEYNDNEGRNLDITIAAELADTNVIDEFFGEDTLMEEFKRENDCQPSSSRYNFDDSNDIITCPICMEKMTRSVLADHLNGCTGIAIKILPPTKKPKKNIRPSRTTTKDILKNAGYSEDILEQIGSASSRDEEEDDLEFLQTVGTKCSPKSAKSTTSSIVDLNSPEDVNSRLFRQRSIYKTTIQCPCCACEVEQQEMNDHLDECLSK